jgi:hypothetical protein
MARIRSTPAERQRRDEKVRQLHTEGMSIRKIADEVGCGKDVVHEAINPEARERRRAQNRERNTSPEGLRQRRDRRAMQTTRSGQEIPVPTREEFDEFVKKVAPPAGRKRPAETDRPHERSD